MIVTACSGDQPDHKESIKTETHAVHALDLFELDGNPQDDPAAGDDWENVYNGTDHAFADSGIVSETGDVSIFTGGGSKDILDIPNWKWKDGSVPDKDNISNAFAAAYLSGGDLIAYFGADRYAVDGDSQVGFWFFHDKIGLTRGAFSGVHQEGDILVLADFTQGGTIGTVKIYKWLMAGGGSDGNLDLVDGGAVLGGPAGTNYFCLGDDLACASINKQTVPSPWPYTPKSGSPNQLPPGAFFEGGINVTQLVPGDLCFSSFLAETRSSQSPTAVLKDFTLGGFETCGISAAKTCTVTALNPPGSPKLFTASFSVTVTNSGASTIPAGAIVSVVDDAGTPSDTSDDSTVNQPLAAPLAPGQSVVIDGSFQTNENPPLANTATVTTTIGTTTVSAVTAPVACQPLPLNPQLSVCKSCATELAPHTDGDHSHVVLQIDFSGKVCNTGDTWLNVSAVDNPAGAVALSSNLLMPSECATFSGSYLPSSASSSDPATASFTDTVTATGSSPALSSSVSASASATCNVCAPSPACP